MINSPGFVVTAQAYLDSMKCAAVGDQLRESLNTAARVVDKPAELKTACDRMRELVRTAGAAPEIRDAVLDAYRALGHEALVAVRSSATSEGVAGWCSTTRYASGTMPMQVG